MHYRAIIIIICLCSVLVETALPQIVQWQGITLLHSTKNDVEKILGKGTESNLYDTAKQRVSVWYSKGTCKQDKSSVWNVPKDTVLGILVAPKGELNVDVVKAKLNQQFEKHPDVEMRNVFIYDSKDGAINMQTRLREDGVEDVSFVLYKPGKSGKNLLCKSRK